MATVLLATACATEVSASGPPGTVVGLKVSTTGARFRVLAFRIGAYRGGTGHLVWASGRLRGQVHAGPTFAHYATRTVVAPWRTSVRVRTGGWRPAFYVLKLTTSGAAAQVPYVVSSRSTVGTVALSVPVATWQASNEWGGYSLYRGPAGDRHAWAVGFDRPYDGVTGYNDFRTAIVPLVVAAEEEGCAGAAPSSTRATSGWARPPAGSCASSPATCCGRSLRDPSARAVPPTTTSPASTSRCATASRRADPGTS
jgi:hypothetical protein